MAQSITADVEGTRLTLLPGGSQRLEALLALIDGAERSLRILFYIFDDDASGTAVRDALLRAVARGVSVSLLVDGFGSRSASAAFFAPLEEGEAHFCRFHPRWGRRFLLRNHQKLALADETRLITGGFNVADDYFGEPAGGAWRDLGLMVEGPAAARLAPYYDALIVWVARKSPRIRHLRRLINNFTEHEGRLQWQLGGPTRMLSPWAIAVCRDMREARRMDMIAAYFGPNPAMLRRIGRVGRRGRSRLLTAAKSDNGATIGAARHTYGALLRRGVEIYEYGLTKLHTKLVVLDEVTHIGSANFDVRSMYINLEMMLRVEDPGFAHSMRAFFETELEASERITPALHRTRATPFARIKWAFSRFIVATMDYNVSRRLNFGLSGK